jgi:hypothetical protein
MHARLFANSISRLAQNNYVAEACHYFASQIANPQPWLRKLYTIETSPKARLAGPYFLSANNRYTREHAQILAYLQVLFRASLIAAMELQAG